MTGSTLNLPTFPILPSAGNGSAVVIQERIVIPRWVDDLATFRQWACSGDYPGSGWVSFLDRQIWVDPGTEEFLTHNQVKAAFYGAIYTLLLRHAVGRYVPDRMLLTNVHANLSTGAGRAVFLWDAMQSGALRLVPGAEEGFIELEGTPDMVLEIVSKTSVHKDNVVLRDLYWKAGIAEYWLVDARGEQPRFDILKHTANGYVATEPVEGWLHSTVFGHEFQLTRQSDPLGHPQFVVAVRP